METIAVFNTRGGSGKSAATVFLADFLSSTFKKRVLIVDLDPQRSSSVALLGEERVDAELAEGKCLATLLHKTVDESPEATDARSILMERPPGQGRGTPSREQSQLAVGAGLRASTVSAPRPAGLSRSSRGRSRPIVGSPGGSGRRRARPPGADLRRRSSDPNRR